MFTPRVGLSFFRAHCYCCCCRLSPNFAEARIICCGCDFLPIDRRKYHWTVVERSCRRGGDFEPRLDGLCHQVGARSFFFVWLLRGLHLGNRFCPVRRMIGSKPLCSYVHACRGRQDSFLLKASTIVANIFLSRALNLLSPHAFLFFLFCFLSIFARTWYGGGLTKTVFWKEVSR